MWLFILIFVLALIISVVIAITIFNKEINKMEENMRKEILIIKNNKVVDISLYDKYKNDKGLYEPRNPKKGIEIKVRKEEG